MGIRHVRFLPDGIAFDRYPYPGARVHPRGLVPWSEVLEVDPAASPPEVRITGETLFVSHELREELARAAEAHAVPTVRRTDVWGMLLDPFLDTWFDDDVQELTLRWLEENGIGRAEAERIRKRVEWAMLHHNAMLWEWVHLGLWDLLEAHRNVWVRLLRGLTPGRYRAFYAWAMEIAGRGGVVRSPDVRDEPEGLARLRDLASREDALGTMVSSARGPMEDKHAWLDSVGAFEEYRGVHRAYAELAADPVAGLEALKRAVFLQWYETCEPACFSGLLGLDDPAGRECLRTLDHLCSQDALDEELTWMLPWYFLVADHAFTCFGEVPALTAKLSALDPNGWEKASPPGDLRLRGRMGEYWQSLFDNLTVRRVIPPPADP